MSQIAFLVCIIYLCLLSFTHAKVNGLTIVEPETKTIFETTYDGCQMTRLGQIKYWAIKYITAAGVSLYKCSPATLDEECAKLVVFRTYIFNWEINVAFSKIMSWKNEKKQYMIPVDQQNAFTSIISKLSGGLWEGDVIRFIWKSGTFTALKGTSVIGSSTVITKSTYQTMINILMDSFFVETVKI